MKKGSLLLILGLLFFHQALLASAVTKSKTASLSTIGDSYGVDTLGDTASELRPKLALVQTNEFEDGEGTIDLDTEGDNYDQCEFPVIVNETDPNCENIDQLIERVRYELEVIVEAKVLTIEQIAALEKSYKFIQETCVAGIYGVENLPQVSLLETASRTSIVSRMKAVLGDTAVSIELLEKKAFKAFMAGSELLEDAQHCTQEEIEAKCEEYLNETNQTLFAHKEFLAEINEKHVYLIWRQSYLEQWKVNNSKYCHCSNSSTYTNDYCCDLPQFAETDDCVCYLSYTDERCCSHPDYSDSIGCQCYNNGTEFNTETCCPLEKYEDTERCQCANNFTIEPCCNHPEYNQTAECVCEQNFGTDLCCSLPKWANDPRCTCITQPFDINVCCDHYPGDPKCHCEGDKWDTNYCCEIQDYSTHPICTCAENFTTSCCQYTEFEQNIECQCIKQYDPDVCCTLPDYEGKLECQCKENFNASCCTLDAYSSNPECVCQHTFTKNPCCDFDSFQGRYECQCMKQVNGTYPLDCCFQEEWLDDYECKCRKQCAAIDPEGEDCCESPRFKYSYPECICRNQKNNAVRPYMCCNYAPYKNNPDYAWDCQCANQQIPIDYSFEPPRNCCSSSAYSDHSLCMCFQNFNASTCCQYNEFSDREECKCWNQTADPLYPNNCCEEPRFAGDDKCICPDQEDPITPHDCCNHEKFTGNHECECRAQNRDTPIVGERNCCDTTYFNNSKICKCFAQESPFGEENCCGFEPFINNFECQCAERTQPFDEEGLQCCNLTTYASTVQCQCHIDFDPAICCQFDEFAGTHECKCESQTTEPTNPEGCCDHWRWVNHDTCKCLNQTDDPLHPLDCCAFYSGDINCICKNQTEPVENGQDCCEADKFKNSSTCLCRNPDYNATHGLECCRPGEHLCNCKDQILDPTYPDNCCDFGDNAETHMCKCSYQTVPITEENNCCDTRFHSSSHECKCAAQLNETGKADGEIDCCDLYPDTPECYCKAITTEGLANGTYNCCELPEYENKPECVCQNTFDPEICCQFNQFEEHIDCKCKIQPVPIGAENCCYMTKWANDTICKCQGQPLDSPLVPYDCCSEEPWKQTEECLCKSQTQAIDPITNRDCCAYSPFNITDKGCRCAKQTVPITEQLNCCDQPQFSNTDDCVCKTATSPFEIENRNCCSTTYFSTHLECTCPTSNDTACCAYTQWNDTQHGCPQPPPDDCYDLYENDTDFSLYCCQTYPEFATLRNCPCLLQGNSHNPLQCCHVEEYSTDPYCKCLNQATPKGELDCCWHSKFSTTEECLCEEATTGINYLQDPPFNCCAYDKWKDSVECKCEAQKTTSLTSPEMCCDLDHYKDEQECKCWAQQTPFDPDNCCAYSKFNSTLECKCAQQENPTTPEYCCALTPYASTLECRCQSQLSPTYPMDCCATLKFQDALVCQCKNDFNLDTCCGIYPSDPRCSCLRNFILDKCCQYQPDHPGCQPDGEACFANDTQEIPYDGDVDNYKTGDNLITIIKGLIYFNELTQDSHQTVYLIDHDSYDPVHINAGSLSAVGLSATDNSNFAYSPELPWEGHFSVNLWIPRGQSDKTLNVFSTEHFAVTVAITEGSLNYRVADQSGQTVASVPVTLDQPTTAWWAGAEGRDALLDAYIPQKVELGFEGSDCWLTVVSINNEVFESEVWGCLVPDSAIISNLASDSFVDIRNHLGAVHLGHNTLANTHNPDDALYISNVYLVGGKDESLRILAPKMVAKPFNADVQNNTAEGLCDPAFDWDRVSILPAGEGALSGLPGTGSSSCSNIFGTSTHGQTLKGVQYSHAFKYIPQYSICGTVAQKAGDLALKTHICDRVAVDSRLEITGTSLNFNLYDFVAYSSNFEDYNPTITVTGSSPSISLVADNEASVRAVITPDVSVETVSTVSLQLEFKVVSFPWIIYNAIHADPTVEIVINARIFGQKTISASFFIKREATGDNFYIIRELRGPLTPVPGANVTFSSEGHVSYQLQSEPTADGRDLNAAVSDLVTDVATTVDQGNYAGSYTDQSSSSIEISIQTFLSYGPTHGYFRPEFIPDRSAVIEISNLSFVVSKQ